MSDTNGVLSEVLLGNDKKKRKKELVVYWSLVFSNYFSYPQNQFFSAYLVSLFVWQPGQSALACLPDGLKEKLVETQEARNKFQCLYKTVHSLSTDNSLKLFHDGILKNKSVEQTGNVESSSNVADMQDRSSDSNALENHFEELQSLIHESPTVKVHLTIDK